MERQKHPGGTLDWHLTSNARLPEMSSEAVACFGVRAGPGARGAE